LRTFRLDRVTALEPLEDAFERPEDFDALEYVLNSLVWMPGTEQMEVLLQTSLENAQQIIPSMMGTLEVHEKGVIFRRSATQLEWILPYLMTLDFPVFVLKPTNLQEKLRAMAAKALQMADSEAI
jgi:predicted DNA-binding transcriptional regulator YafY